MDMVIADLKEPRFSAVTEQYYRDEFLQGEVYAGSEAEIVDFEELSEKAEEVEQADLEAKQAEFRENNPDVVADFRAKTEELFHSLDGQSADDIEMMVYAYVQSQIDEYGLDAEIVDFAIVNDKGEISSSVDKNKQFRIKMKIQFKKDVNNQIFAYTI